MSDPNDLGREAPSRPSKRWWLVGAGLGLVVLSPVVCVGGTLFGMHDSFRRIEEKAAQTPDALAEGVGMTRVAMIACALLLLAGLVLALVGILWVQRDSRRT